MTTMSLAGPQMNVILSREEAETILLPHVERLNCCIENGWRAWKTDYAHKSHILRSRSRAAIVYDEIVHCAIEAFANLDGVKTVRQRGSLMIFIGNCITLRFKKIRKSGRCSNIKTETQVMFLAQMQLPGMLDGTLVHAGYQLDELQQEIKRKAVVCQLDNKVLWEIQLTGEAAVFSVMPSATDPTAPRTTPRFVPKDGIVEAAKAATGDKE